MNIKLELLGNEISELVRRRLDKIDIDINQIAQTTAISALSEIQKIIQNDELSDFDAVEEIVLIFEKYHICCGGRHDFG